jgi:hypothetical protein
MVDLMFRDESKHVIKKANRTTKNGGVKKHSKPTSATHAPPLASTSFTPVNRIKTMPSKSFIDAATAVISEKALAAAEHDGAQSDSATFLAMLTPSSGPSIGSPASDVSDDTVEIADTDLLRIHYPLSRSLQERGTAFFFSRYVAVDFGCYQNYDFVYDVWKPGNDDGEKVDSVRASMTAVGLAGLSKITRSHDMMIQACKSYGAALKLTNAALMNPNEAVKDSTMLSVLVLGTYEFITGRTHQTMAAWKGHVNGAAALTRLRGTAPFRTQAGIRMFLMLCHSVLISCIQGGMPMPPAMLDLRNELVQFANTKDPTWRIFEPICRALQIRYDIKNGQVTDADEIVAQLADVEHELATIVDEMPRFWHYRCVRVSHNNPAIMGSWCHIYPSFAHATTWNGIRTMRILVQETILEQLCSTMARSPLPPMQHQVLLVRSMRMLQLLGEAVIASVPQHFGIVTSRGYADGDFILTAQAPHRLASACPIPSPRPARQITPDSPGSSPRPTLLDPTQSDDGRGDAERFMTLASASNTIIWPLYTLGMSSSCTSETRQYIIDRLDAIHVETRLDQARSVKSILQAKVESLPWNDIPLTQFPDIPDDAFPTMV